MSDKTLNLFLSILGTKGTVHGMPLCVQCTGGHDLEEGLFHE